jgi:Tfp pilus assembly protein PilX
LKIKLLEIRDFKSMPNHQTKKGAISILLAVLILTSVFIIVFGLSGIMLKQIRMSGQASDSVKAYQAADSGIEWALYQVKQGIAMAVPIV